MDDAMSVVEERLAWWRYPFAATRLRVKASASSLGRLTPLEHAVYPGRQKESGKSRGQAYHRVIQFLDPDADSLEKARTAAEALLKKGVLETEDLEAVDLELIVMFWKSEIGVRIKRQQREYLHRELPFTARFSNRELRDLGFQVSDDPFIEDEPILIQGIVDLAVVTPEEIWLLDFKSESFRPEELAERTERHTPQLSLYRDALEKTYRRTVTQTWIHYLELRRTMTIPPSKNRD
ncbi:MAG: ATP-dependent helicase/nuclease subunit A [Verrucomicrobia subdivision 3 bacterium]|nr:ATP-dependent helicase/nuclease subunit A [Limisphaerales bacterium]MCS1416387.1 ATP-dependent helicase/nuclease subunit A [Limisphaerales bacterium]